MGEIEVGEFIIEWDDNKAEINRRKHDVTFEMAARVFLDEYRIDYYDEDHSDDEERIKVIGMVEKILVVIYMSVERDCASYRLEPQTKKKRPSMKSQEAEVGT
ncbi:MAG: BrnT family toxin [Selenomonadaceae bacterium]|nr:BrnT family toxin [Selenomonadaceae bacterium]MBQ9496582.1 BrnT family toxin [Selenomonadaceae bacterium]